MSQELTAKQERAALLLADDELSDEDIAHAVGISRRTLARWKGDPHMQDRIGQHIADLAAALSKYHIARKDKRLAAYDKRWRLLEQVRAERAADPKIARTPGASTGLIAHRLKMIGTGEDAHMVEECEVDTGALKAQLDLEKQAAVEAGQWEQKLDLSGGMAVRFTINVDRTDRAAAE